MLFLQDNTPFCTGRASCNINPLSGSGSSNRILVQIKIEGIDAQAVLDTGGVYLVIESKIASELDLDPNAAIDHDTLNIRGITYQGTLHRVHLSIPAEEGESLVCEVTAFVPNATIEDWSGLPSFLGLTGCMEFMRFAIDPAEDHFYFANSERLGA